MHFKNTTRDEIIEALLARKAQAAEQNLEEAHALAYILSPVLNDRVELIANEQRALGDVADALKLVDRYKAEYGNIEDAGEKPVGPMEPAELDAEAYLGGSDGITITNLAADNVYVSINHTHLTNDDLVEAGEVKEPTTKELIDELKHRFVTSREEGETRGEIVEWLVSQSE